METAVEVREVTKRYGPVKALDRVNLVVREGKFILLVGPNGSGKSTLLSVIAGFTRPDSGVVRVYGFDPWREHGRVSRLISALLDRVGFPPFATVREILEAVAEAKGVDWRDVERLAGRLGVDYWGRRFSALSSGMARRVLLLATLVGDYKLLMLDEPFQALDRATCEKLIDILAGVKGEKTVIVATHILPPRLAKLADRIAVMDSGRIVAEGPVEQVKVGEWGVVAEIRVVGTNPRA